MNPLNAPWKIRMTLRGPTGSVNVSGYIGKEAKEAILHTLAISEKRKPESLADSGLAVQAETYARERVNAALQEAIDQVAMHGGSVEIEAAIRALIPRDAK